MSDKSSSARQYSTIGCLLLLIAVSLIFIVWIGWRVLHAPVPPKPANDSLHRVDSLRKVDSLQKKDSLAKADSIGNTKSTRRKSDFLQPYFSDSLFSFHVLYDSSKNYDGEWWFTIRRVDITDPYANVIQNVRPRDLDNFYRYSEGQFIMEDMNFDGYDDFRIKAGAYVNGCATYLCWLYDPAKKKFMENAELEGTFDPEFDPKEKLVYSIQNMTDSPFNEIRKCFSWGNGKLVLQHSEVCDYGPNNSTLITMTKRIQDKLVTRKHVYADAPITQTGQVIYNWDEMK
ncbi:MAG TPA: hypothetical protein VL651_07510 [Bacteroidia bacterium]|jgi:hypothetical protein|nr:hypothetical protein [Bacteroidia bacterium]